MEPLKKIGNLKLTGTLIILVAVAMLSGCKDEEKEALKQENQQLQTELKQTETAVNEMLQTFDEIEQNLALVKEKQGNIEIDSENPESNLSEKDKREKIMDEIQDINALMEENRQKISDLQTELSKSGLKLSQFQKRINSLLTQVTEKEKEVEQLHDNLTSKKLEIAGLNATMTNLNMEKDTLYHKVSTQSTEISKLDSALNTTYYTEGTYKELKERGVITKVGWTPWSGKKVDLNENLSKDEFIKFDKREVTSIPINAKKAELVSEHPEGTYEFEKNEDGMIASLEIKQPDEFWKVSDYLVVEVK